MLIKIGIKKTALPLFYMDTLSAKCQYVKSSILLIFTRVGKLWATSGKLQLTTTHQQGLYGSSS